MCDLLFCDLLPVPNQLQYLVGHFLVLLLVGVAGALDEEQAVLGGGGHVRVVLRRKPPNNGILIIFAVRYC